MKKTTITRHVTFAFAFLALSLMSLILTLPMAAQDPIEPVGSCFACNDDGGCDTNKATGKSGCSVKMTGGHQTCSEEGFEDCGN